MGSTSMNEKSYLENLKHLVVLQHEKRHRLERKGMVRRGAASNKDRRLSRICGANGLSCEFREREYVDLTLPLGHFFIYRILVFRVFNVYIYFLLFFSLNTLLLN